MTVENIRELLNNDLSTLTPSQAKVLRMRFGFDMREHTPEEVAAHFDMTADEVREIEVNALRKLRHPAAVLS